MQSVSVEYKNESEKLNTLYELRLLCDGKEVQDVIDDFEYDGMENPDGNVTIGSACSAACSFSIRNPSTILTGNEIVIQQGVNTNGTVQWYNVGKFKVQKPKISGDKYIYSCSDGMTHLFEMAYFSDLTFPATDIQIVNEICQKKGISFVTTGLTEHTIKEIPAGYTCREIIGYMAALQGKNAVINKDGNLEFRWYSPVNCTIDDNRIYLDGTDIDSEEIFYINKITCGIGQDKNYEVKTITSGDGSTGISIENPFMTQEILDDVFSRIGGFSVRSMSVKFLGYFFVELGDIVTVENNGNIYSVPVMQISHSWDGGLISRITAVADTEVENDIDLTGPSTKAMERTHAQLLLVNKLIATKASIEYLETNYIKTSELDAVSADIENAVITNLQGKYASIEYLQTNYATIERLGAVSAKIDTLEVNALTANSAVIQSLQSGVADINTLMFGSAAGGTIQTEFSNSVIANLGDAQIESAMIKELAADKITGLDLNTTKLSVHSEDGKSIWKDNTIQISDAARVRVQIGKDSAGDYNIYIWDKNGELMFDPLYGIQEGGIKQAIIRNDMVSDTANISAAKLDISSLFKEINGSTETIKSSKIYVDADKQTLDVSFKNMSTTVSEVTTTASSALTTAQGANSTASSALSAASAAAGTANTANSTANTAKTTAETANSTANKAASNASSALSTANTASANAASALNKVTTLTETVTTQGTQITTIQGQISSKIWQQDITTAVSSVQIGGRNLCLNSAKHNFATSKTAGTVTTTLVADGDALSGYHTENKTTSATANFYSYPYKECQPGKTYTWSFWGKASVTKSGNIGCERGGQKAVSFTTEWQKYTHTFTASNNQHSAFTFYLNWKNGEILYIRDFKFEEGTKATTWTPAPEDIDSAIETVNTTLTTKYSNLEQTLEGFKTTVSETYATKTTVDNNLATSKSYADTVGSDTLASAKADTDNKLKAYATTVDMTSAINQKADSITSTVSATYATKTQLSGKKDTVYARFSGNGNSAAYCHLCQIKINSTYINTPVVIEINQRGRGYSQGMVTFNSVNGTDPGLARFAKTGSPLWYILRAAAGTWDIYINKTEPWDSITVTDYFNGYADTNGIVITWKCINVNAVAGWTEAKQLAALYGVDSTAGGTDGSASLATSGALYSTNQTINTKYTQLSNKFNWIVQSGTSATDFTITDRLASLTAKYINLNGLVTFSGLDSNAQSTITGAADNAIDALSMANTANNTATAAKTAAANAQSTASAAAGTANTAASTASTANTRATYHYGTCSTAAGTAAKAVALSGFSLYTGATVSVLFSYANTVANPTLNVNGTGAKAIRVNNATITAAYYWAANNTVTFVYNGTYWVMADSSANSIIATWCYNNNQTYINGGKIYTGTITADKIAADAIKSKNYVANSVGSFLNLADGSFSSKNLKWDSSGDLEASSATITGGSIKLLAEQAESKIEVAYETNSAFKTAISPRYLWMYQNDTNYMRLSGYSGGSISMVYAGNESVSINAVIGVKSKWYGTMSGTGILKIKKYSGLSTTIPAGNRQNVMISSDFRLSGYTFIGGYVDFNSTTVLEISASVQTFGDVQLFVSFINQTGANQSVNYDVNVFYIANECV